MKASKVRKLKKGDMVTVKIETTAVVVENDDFEFGLIRLFVSSSEWFNGKNIVRKIKGYMEE